MSYWANLQGHAEVRNPATKLLLPCWDGERAKCKWFARASVDAREIELDQRKYIHVVSLPVTPVLVSVLTIS